MIIKGGVINENGYVPVSGHFPGRKQGAPGQLKSEIT